MKKTICKAGLLGATLFVSPLVMAQAAGTPEVKESAATRLSAGKIDKDYDGREILMIAVLKGSFLFIADLVRAVKTPTVIDFVRLASYGSATQSSGIIELRKDLEMSIKDKDVLIVEDIVDSGQTLESLRNMLLNRQPASLRSSWHLSLISRLVGMYSSVPFLARRHRPRSIHLPSDSHWRTSGSRYSCSFIVLAPIW